MSEIMRKTCFSLAIYLLTQGQGALAERANQGEGCKLLDTDTSKITIEEFADFECPYCSRGSEVMDQLIKDYPGKIKLVFRNLPLGFHSLALPAAKAMTAACLQSPSLAHEFEREIFKNQAQFKNEGEPFLLKTAEKLGLDIVRLKEDMDSQAIQDSIESDKKRAAQLNIKGTPAFKVGNEIIMGAHSIEDFRKSIDKQIGN